jgi:hypothetical protein
MSIQLQRLQRGDSANKSQWVNCGTINPGNHTALLVHLMDLCKSNHEAYRAHITSGIVSAKWDTNGQVYFGMPDAVLRAYGKECGGSHSRPEPRHTQNKSKEPTEVDPNMPEWVTGYRGR